MNYFNVIKISDNLFQIREQKKVSETLIIGDDKALLIDTGYGNKELVSTVKSITDKPLTIINTHLHFDHCSGNKFFDEIYIGENDMPTKPSAMHEIFDYVKGKLPRILYPAVNLLIKNFDVVPHGEKYIPVHDGYVFSLGGRDVTVRDLPGHTYGSIVLLDKTSRSIITGDAINNTFLITVNPRQNLFELSKRYKAFYGEIKDDYDVLRFSHQIPGYPDKLPVDFLMWFSDMLLRIDLDKCTKSKYPVIPEPICVYEETNTPYGNVNIKFLPMQIKN